MTHCPQCHTENPAQAKVLYRVRDPARDRRETELARTYVSYARLLEARGNSVGARDYLVKAIGMFRDMGMAWDLERAEQTLRVL